METDEAFEIVRRLADGVYHSPGELARHLGTALENLDARVRRAGDVLDLAIEMHPERGYRLSQPLELLDAERIREDLRVSVPQIALFADLPSTNTYLMERIQAPSGTLCLAEHQSAGRGRRGRTWVSPFGTNLALSLLWRYESIPPHLGGLSLGVGVAVARVLREEGVGAIRLKWPNDLVWHRRKLGGILIETALAPRNRIRVVVGIGLNVRLDPAQAAEIRQPWVDLETIGVSPGRNRLVARLTDALVPTLETYGREGLAPFLPFWRDRDAFASGERVAVRNAGETLYGIYRGITDQGALRLQIRGRTRILQAGELSLRSAP